MCWKGCFSKVSGLALLACSIALAQDSSRVPETLQKILDRLDVLEKQNQAVMAEIQALRQALKAEQGPVTQTQAEPLDERVSVAEQHIKDQAQTKVSSSQRMPISLTGMFLFDSYWMDGTRNKAFQAEYPGYGLGNPFTGATLSQSIIGLNFQGPHIFGDGRIHGDLSMDFWAQATGDSVLRIRRGVVSFDWKRRSITFGQDKTLIAPLQPTSYARVAVPPLSIAGNLWYWRPQVRYEERLPLSSATQVAFEGALYQTDETYTAPPQEATVQRSRPALQARIELRHQLAEDSRFVIGVAGHESRSHVMGVSIPSRVISGDFLYKPARWFELSGTVFHGENFANLGAISGGVAIYNGKVAAIHGTAGWVQVAFPVTTKLTLDLYSGLQSNRGADLGTYDIARTSSYAGNILYRFSPNVVVGFEGSRDRVQFLSATDITANRYDATVAYLF